MRGALIATAVCVGILGGVAGDQRARSDPGGWREIAWPFPRDGWPAGRAFHCTTQACGEEIELYVRPKIGFCNCDSGVADDDEVDRVADLDLISERFAPLAPGKPVRIAEMSGRLRNYHRDVSGGARHAAIGIAVSHRCDMLVAVAEGEGGAGELQRGALDFLGTHEIHHWMMAALGGG